MEPPSPDGIAMPAETANVDVQTEIATESDASCETRAVPVITSIDSLLPANSPREVPAEGEGAEVLRAWARLGLNASMNPDGTSTATMPESVVGLVARSADANSALREVCEPIMTSMPVQCEAGGRGCYLFRLEPTAHLPSGLSLPAGIDLLLPGQPVQLSATAPMAEALPLLGPAEIAHLAQPKLDPVIVGNPLAQYSLRGTAEEFERQAVNAKPLLGNLCLTGQATVWYAPPNSGKTLIMLKLLNDAVAEGRVTPDNVYYINADDSSEGFATKIRLMDDLGAHTLAPNLKGFNASLLPELLHTMADGKKAKGAVIIIDTVKKAASLMDKGKASAFTAACRSAVMAGATIIGFAHTNKQPQANGKLQYGGTTDLRDDFDAAYIMGPVEMEGFDGDKVVRFESIKARGSNARSATYCYADGETVPYAERLASVRMVTEDELNGFRRVEEAKADAEVVEAVEACIRAGDFAKIALARAVATRAGISERAAIRLIEKYTGTDPATAKWRFQRKDRGAMIYTLLPSVPEPATMAA